jgi:hypothetical protein
MNIELKLMWRFGDDGQLTAALSYRAPAGTAVALPEMQISRVFSSMSMHWGIIATVPSRKTSRC